jgi:hypothetical protein
MRLPRRQKLPEHFHNLALIALLRLLAALLRIHQLTINFALLLCETLKFPPWSI